MILDILGLFLCSFMSLFVFRKFAIYINLVDQPNERKHHTGAVPLVGGLAIFIVVFSYLIVFSETISSSALYLFCAGTLLIVGVLDDLFDISFRVRLVIQVVISCLMMFVGELTLNNAGQLIGPFDLEFSYFCYLFTVVAVVGAINAFNMVDGIDGLLGALATVTFTSLAILFYLNNQKSLAVFSTVIVVTTIPYILMNLGFPLGQRFKVFMGDAGSTVIGFTVIWLLLEGSQPEQNSAFSAVTALWLAAVPIIDAVSTIARRVRKGQSPFQPDREHLHHILLRLGFSSRQALLVICTASALLAAAGIIAHIYQVPDYIMFYLFIALTLAYYFCMLRIWRISVHVRKFIKKLNSKQRGLHYINNL